MKKIYAFLLACSMIGSFVFTGCGDEKAEIENDSVASSVSETEESSDKEDSKEESSEDDIAAETKNTEKTEKEEVIVTEKVSDTVSATDEAIVTSDESVVSDPLQEKTPVEVIKGNAGDPKLVGAWSDDELEAAFSSLRFTADGVLSTVVDCSSMIRISGDSLILSDIPCKYTFDGVSFKSVMNAESMGLETGDDLGIEEFSIMEMVKLTPGSKDDVNGIYLLTGGMMFDTYSATLPVDGDIYVVVDGENLLMEVEICGYTSDGSTITMNGDVSELFGSDETTLTYKVDGDTLELTAPDGDVEVMTRSKDIESKINAR